MAGALTGLKILDFSTLLPGPFATMNFADMGAEVVRVTTTTRLDSMDVTPPLLPDSHFSVVGAQVGRNKKTLTLNLKKPEAIEIVKKLIKEYDILLEQFRPGVMNNLGLGYEALSAINPSLIYCSLTGYGQTGSLRNKAGHDINYLSLSGIMGYSGLKEKGPVLTGIQISDIAGGSYNAMIAMLAAVIYRGSTGKGQHLDISMLDGAVALNALFGPGCLYTDEAPKREGEMFNGGSVYDFYETKDGEYVSFGGSEPKFWEAFCMTLDKKEWIPIGFNDDPAIKKEVTAIIKAKTRGEWMEIFGKLDACFEPVLSLSEAMNSDVVKEREMVVEVPAGPIGSLRQIGSPYKFSESPVQFRHAGKPASEADTVEILEGIGYSRAQINQMDAQGVLK